MTDFAYIVAAYAVVLGGTALYAVTLWRRIRRAAADDDEAR